MFKPGQNFEELFSQIANANQSWFQNLLNHSSHDAANKPANPFLDMYQKFFDHTQSYLTSQNQFYQEQLAMWSKFCDINQASVEAEQKKTCGSSLR